MSRETAIVVAVLFWAGFFIYRYSLRTKYPARLIELQDALRVHSAARLHHSNDKDDATAKELAEIAKHLGYAQMLANSAPAEVAREWPKINYWVRMSINPDILNRLGYFEADRRSQVTAAVFDLESRIEKKRAAAHGA
jgi:hypothetical protein